ncbi:hypothetical protein [Streptomyces sp. SS8]
MSALLYIDSCLGTGRVGRFLAPGPGSRATAPSSGPRCPPAAST